MHLKLQQVELHEVSHTKTSRRHVLTFQWLSISAAITHTVSHIDVSRIFGGGADNCIAHSRNWIAAATIDFWARQNLNQVKSISHRNQSIESNWRFFLSPAKSSEIGMGCVHWTLTQLCEFDNWVCWHILQQQSGSSTCNFFFFLTLNTLFTPKQCSIFHALSLCITIEDGYKMVK